MLVSSRILYSLFLSFFPFFLASFFSKHVSLLSLIFHISQEQADTHTHVIYTFLVFYFSQGAEFCVLLSVDGDTSFPLVSMRIK